MQLSMLKAFKMSPSCLTPQSNHITSETSTAFFKSIYLFVLSNSVYETTGMQVRSTARSVKHWTQIHVLGTRKRK